MSRTRNALTLLAALAVAVPFAAGPAGAASSAASSAVAVRTGSTPATAVLPNDRFTVADSRQLTGRRIALPVPRCTAATVSVCDAARLLNQLDGFDLRPRVAIPFTGPIQLDSFNAGTVYVDGPGGRTRLVQVVQDPATDTVYGTTEAYLHEQSHYTVVVTRGVLDATGHPIAAGVRVPFTTMSATTELDKLRRSLDDGAADRQSGATRSVSFAQGTTTTVFPPTDAELINRLDQTSADPNAPLTTSQVPNLAPAGAGCIAFGSFESPQFVTKDAVIPAVPTSQTPPARSKSRVGFALIVPAGPPPAGGWPVAVYGPGFTRSYFDLFVTADNNAAAGIATIATDPLGHGFGPQSKISVGAPGAQTTFLSYGRGRDMDGDGKIGDSEGVQPSDHKTVVGGKVVRDDPSPYALVGLRDGLIQTTVDNMALIRSVEHGITVPSCGGQDVPLAKTSVEYYGLSFGGIYGTMLMGTDPHVQVGLLNVPGGPIIDIARLSGFRPLLADQLRVSKPNLLNGGPGLNGFTEDIPMPADPRVTHPRKGAIAIQHYLYDGIWLERPGGPETYAPLIRLRPRYGAKTVEFQTAFGDNTVPNYTAGEIYRAGKLFDRVTYYRNDKTPTSGTNPHGWLADPTLAGRYFGEAQLTTFLKTGGATVINPNPAFFEVPIADPNNTTCLHYPQPQSGQSAFPPAAAGECPALLKEPTGHPASGATEPAAGGRGGAAAPSLPTTGGSPLVALLAVALVCVGVAVSRLRRRA